ncbi:hypothetical protein [Bifidobacterium aemilianum]|uniref:hypothetical protein n=1 Tax=Bifidobacterium aemilianum TaxID=2493120 RepID=UPI001374BDD1|nr:hypothetical protein [Bifidobacterium aemilianum]
MIDRHRLTVAQRRMVAQAAPDGSEDFWLSTMLGRPQALVCDLREQLQRHDSEGRHE